MAALAFAAMVQMRPRDVIRIGAVLVVLAVLTATVSSITLADTKGWYEKTMLDEASPKKMVTFAAAKIMSSPKNVLLGVGMGQYGSRAALITSGDYLSVKIPDVLLGESQYYHELIVPPLAVFQKQGEGSAISKPYYSALNQIVEFGVPLTLLLLAAGAFQFLRNRQLSASPVPHIAHRGNPVQRRARIFRAVLLRRELCGVSGGHIRADSAVRRGAGIRLAGE